MTLGERIRLAMDAAGLSQAELAAKAHTTEATISRIINGKRAAHSSTLEAIARALNVPADWLLGGEATRSPSLVELRSLAADASPMAQAFLADLEAQYPYVTDEDWRILAKVLAGLVAESRTQPQAQRDDRAAEDTAPGNNPETPSRNGTRPHLARSG